MLRMRGADGVDREGQGSSDPWGLFDMIGTIVQSCWDILDPGVYGSYRVFRGMRARREIASASGDCGGPTLDRNS
jgi:hypothetical protein